MSLDPAAFLERAVRDGVTPGAQACAVLRGRVVLDAWAGSVAPGGEAVGPGTLFDVASLTKVLATTAVAHALLSRKTIALETPAVALLPLRGGDRERITVRHLLAHTSGLPAWRPLFTAAMSDPVAGALYPGPAADRTAAFDRARALVFAQAIGLDVESAPGARRTYGDPAFLLLGELLAAAAGDRLDRLVHGLVVSPLGLEHTRFFDLAAGSPAAGAIALTGTIRPREPAPGQEKDYAVPPQLPCLVPGEVDDDNAFALGGIAGHAGLFSTARDVARFGAAILEELGGAGRIGRAEVLEELCAEDRGPVGPRRALGFDLPSGEAPSAGTRLGQGPRGAIGHLGFTGCSLWIDRDRELSVALLTNRVALGRARTADGIRALRPAFHDALVEALEEGR